MSEYHIYSGLVF